jgi:hypothetical protein
MENRNKKDDIRSCYQLVNHYETESNRNVKIKMLLLQRTKDISKVDCSNGLKTMKMPSLSLPSLSLPSILPNQYAKVTIL